MREMDFPRDFVWGTSTASYQVEGAGHEDGKSDSIWSAFERRPGAIANMDSGEVTCDQYHRFREDIALMKDMGVNAYRFSMSWSRVIPSGDGAINEKGLDYYKQLCEELHRNGIEPYMTWYHWDLPQCLQERNGGWESRETVKQFGDYVDRISRRLGGLVRHYFTTNEFLGATHGYRYPWLAPGLTVSRKRFNQVRHHLLCAHGTALAVLRAAVPEAKVGFAENPFIMVPLIDTPEHVEAAKKAFREYNAHFITAVMEGRYLDSFLEAEKQDAPEFTAEDMKLISAPMDFLGLNIYFGQFVRPAPERESGYEIFAEDTAPLQPGLAEMHFEPSAMYWGCRIARELWNVPEILITENGMRAADRMAPSGEIYDLYRIKYMREYLLSLARAMAEGCPVKGYFHWSFMDNLEWDQGFVPRHGLYYTDYHTGIRHPKTSAKWYRELIRTGRIV